MCHFLKIFASKSYWTKFLSKFWVLNSVEKFFKMKIFDLTQNFLRLTVKDINTNCPSNDEYKLCDKTIGDDLFNCIIGKFLWIVK